MTKRIVRVCGALALSLGLLAGPLAEISSARHRSQYPPEARRCTTTTRREGRFLRIRVVCRGLGTVLNIRIVVRSEPLYLGTFPTDESGSIDTTIPVPEGLKPGSHHLEIF